MSKTHENHIVPVSTYLTIFTILIVMTAVTVWVAFHDFGFWNTPVAMIIASFKATLVLLFFMHLKYSPRLMTIVFFSSAYMLALLILIVMADITTRTIPAVSSVGM